MSSTQFSGFTHVMGSRIKTSDPQLFKHCDRCGRDMKTDRKRRKDGLVLCSSCINDKWYIETAGKKAAS